MAKQPGMICWRFEHMRLVAAGCALLFWMLYFYAGVFYVCARLPVYLKLYPKETKTAVNFVIGSFDTKVWYWLCVLLPRAVLLCIAGPIASDAGNAQVLITILVNSLYFCLVA